MPSSRRVPRVCSFACLLACTTQDQGNSQTSALTSGAAEAGDSNGASEGTGVDGDEHAGDTSSTESHADTGDSHADGGSSEGEAGTGHEPATSHADSAGDAGTSGETGSTHGDTTTGSADFEPDPSWTKHELLFDQFAVPTTMTNYMCTGFTMSVPQLRHMVAFQAVIDDTTHVHHIILYKLQSPKPGVWDCSSMPQGARFQWGWAPGGEPLVMPDEAGFLVGDDGDTHFGLQVHYNNPLADTDFVDSSGVNVFTTEHLRPNHAGVLMLGTVGGIVIPPGMSEFPVENTCPASITSSLAVAPLMILGSGLHAHELGRKLWTDQFRGGDLIGQIGKKDPYSFNDQGFEPVDATIMAGDELVTHCVYDSTSRTEPTYGGESTQDEMCLNFLLYYPAVEQEYCGTG